MSWREGQSKVTISGNAVGTGNGGGLQHGCGFGLRLYLDSVCAMINPA